ncbi:MAG: acetoacetate decarboxylase family protein [Candidatus Schekmanbacteria bacterium]|nr:acetoacetate decarboxylase family protein [Candidatus Schekmanbacteria bacterium]
MSGEQRTTSEFFRGVEQREIPIRQWRGYSPLFYYDASMTAVVFTADAAAVQALMPTPRHRPLRPLPGTALVAIHCFQYRASQLGAYCEVSLSAGISYTRDAWAHGALHLVRSVLSERYEAYVFQLPVDSEVAMAGGIDYLNVPKYMARMAFQERGGQLIVTVYGDERGGPELFTLAVPSLPARAHHSARARDVAPLRVMELASYPVKGGRTLRAELKVNLIDSATSWLPRGVALRLGEHGKARQLRALRLGHAVELIYAPRCEMILSMSEADGPPR